MLYYALVDKAPLPEEVAEILRSGDEPAKNRVRVYTYCKDSIPKDLQDSREITYISSLVGKGWDDKEELLRRIDLNIAFMKKKYSDRDYTIVFVEGFSPLVPFYRVEKLVIPNNSRRLEQAVYMLEHALDMLERSCVLGSDFLVGIVSNPKRIRELRCPGCDLRGNCDIVKARAFCEETKLYMEGKTGNSNNQ